jgi:3-oxoacyl-[acyl-carrier protein] reductase
LINTVKEFIVELRNARILITGGSLGIGKECAKLLVEQGAKVAITGRDKSRLSSAASLTGATPIQADVSIESDIDKTYAEFLEEFGGLDCLVNNAGIGVHKPLVEITSEEFEQVWRVNVLGPALMAQKAAQIFIKQNYGNIINISSTSGLRGYANGTIYVASKFALRGMSECWRAELRKHNVRIVTINPSEVTTAFGASSRTERPEEKNKLRSAEIAHTVKSVLEMDNRGFIQEVNVWATNPW